MKMPRDITGDELLKVLKSYGYVVTRRKGSHMRITTTMHGEHHEVIPAHDPIKVGTLAGILRSVAGHHKMTVDDLIKLL